MAKGSAILTMLFCFVHLCAVAQVLDDVPFLHQNPRIVQLSRHDFNSNEQFYAMATDKEGILYFGNNDGILVYDGENWQTVSLPNNSSVTSMLAAEDGTIYAGGYNELGKVRRDALGNYYYDSLKYDLNLDEDTEFLYQAHQLGDYIVFRSFNSLVLLSEKGITYIKPRSIFNYSEVVNGRLLVMDFGFGLMEFEPENLSLKPFVSEYLEDLNALCGIVPGDVQDEVFLVSKKGNVFLVDLQEGLVELWTEILKAQEVDEVTGVKRVGDQMLIGTQNSKVLTMDIKSKKQSEIQGVFRENNPVVVSFDQIGDNIWILTKNGLVFLEYGLKDFHIFDKAAVYDMLINDGQIYLATDAGVYRSEFKSTASKNFQTGFKKIPGLEGQVWSVQQIEGDILVSGHNGLHHLKGDRFELLAAWNSFWKVIPAGKTDAYLATSYTGIYPLRKAGDGWRIGGKIEGFDESSRDILYSEKEDTYWVCHGYQGVYRLKLTPELDRFYALEHYTDQNGLDSQYNINVRQWEGEVVFTTNTGIFTFEEGENEFLPHAKLNEVLDPALNTRQLSVHNDRIWYVQDDQIGFVDALEDHPSPRQEDFLGLKGKLNRSMEAYLPLERDRVLVGANDGLYLYYLDSDPEADRFQTFISGASYSTPSSKEEKSLVLRSGKVVELPSAVDVVRLEFNSPGMSVSQNNQYQYKLEEVDQDWSSWDDRAFKEYTYLSPGTYTFKVRARNLIGETASEASYRFEIARAWHQAVFVRWLAAGLVLAAILFLVWAIRRMVRKRVEEARRVAERSRRLLQLEIEQLKLRQRSEIIEQQKQQLEDDLLVKGKELANYTMFLVSKQDILSYVYEELKSLRNKVKLSGQVKKINEMISRIRQHEISEDHMKVFDVNFERVHGDFFNSLLQINPNLTQKELRLCAFVKMDLSNKEIAPLLNISVRGVETSRYRIRKKLGVQESNFKTYLDGLTEPFKTPA